MRRARAVSLLLLACGLAPSPYRAAASPAAAPPAEPLVRSTGQVDSALEPAMPTSGVALEIGADEKPVLQEGRATPSAYQLFTFRPPAGRLFELRLFAPGAPEGSVAMIIYRNDAKEPVAGAGPRDGTQMWMSAGARGDTFRILVRSTRPGETPFQLGAKLHPQEPGE